MQTVEKFDVGNRIVYVVTGRISQTVNVCTPENRRGDYEWTIRLSPANKFIASSDVPEHSGINSLVEWLRKRDSFVENQPIEAPEDCFNYATKENEPTDQADAAWIDRTMAITEICINELVREFLSIPYVHRVEHSIHTRLYGILRSQPHFDGHLALGEGGMFTQPIHKEWPEFHRREDKTGRGNFDLAILPPGQLRRCTLKQFEAGALKPAIAIEMGLNYGKGHLSGDAEKLLNSEIRHGYLVHLVRERGHEARVDEIIQELREESSIKIAFARFDGSRRYVKLLGDDMIGKVM
jgi:hypothetical protein